MFVSDVLNGVRVIQLILGSCHATFELLSIHWLMVNDNYMEMERIRKYFVARKIDT